MKSVSICQCFPWRKYLWKCRLPRRPFCSGLTVSIMYCWIWPVAWYLLCTMDYLMKPDAGFFVHCPSIAEVFAIDRLWYYYVHRYVFVVQFTFCMGNRKWFWIKHSLPVALVHTQMYICPLSSNFQNVGPNTICYLKFVSWLSHIKCLVVG